MYFVIFWCYNEVTNKNLNKKQNQKYLYDQDQYLQPYKIDFKRRQENLLNIIEKLQKTKIVNNLSPHNLAIGTEENEKIM